MIRIYRNRDTHKKVPLFAGMSIIEKFVMITAPILIAFIIHEIISGYVWWLRLSISIGITTVILLFVYLFATLMSKIGE